MYSKPLAARSDGMREAPTKVKRGAPLNGAARRFNRRGLRRFVTGGHLCKPLGVRA